MFRSTITIVLLATLAVGGCRSSQCECDFGDSSSYQLYTDQATEIEYADVQQCLHASETEQTFAPRSIDNAPPAEFWDLTLEEAVQIALANSKVLKDLGGRVLSAGDAVPTVYDVAIRESDPTFGPEAALSAFDTQLSSSLFWQKNDRVFNNSVLGGGVREFRQDLGTFDLELSKTAATGTRFSVLNRTEFDRNNSTANLFPSAWDVQYDFAVRQPLLQGAGVEFNRIAGPNGRPGLQFSNGVVISRINTDISLADFEAGVRNFVSDVELAYWELYFAYRDLDAKRAARDKALDVWRSVQARYKQDLPGGEAEKEAQAREQYYQFQDELQDALNGTPSAGRSVGVYRGERALRRLMGLPSSDQRQIRPVDEPSAAHIHYAWDELTAEANFRRVELRRQRWVIKRREMEHIAARNFTMPRLDAVARYRLRGFGDELAGDGAGQYATAYKDLASGDHNEWEVGLQLNMPLGFRQGWAGVRQAELQLARARAVLEEQEAQVAHELADAVSELHRAQGAIRTGYNRLSAAHQNLLATEAAYRVDRASLDLLLEAQRRLSDAQSRYHRALADHALAIRSVHLNKGSLLQYNGVLLSEGGWPCKAYEDAAQVSERWVPRSKPYSYTLPGPVSAGAYPQEMLSR